MKYEKHFDVVTDGFCGSYYPLKGATEKAFITMFGDDTDDYLAKGGVKYLHSKGCSVMTMAPEKKDYGHHNYPLERIETAIGFLKHKGYKKIGIIGLSTTGMVALAAASYIPDITLTVALSPSDFIRDCEGAIMIILQLILYCLLFTLMVKYAVRGGAIDGLYFYPKTVQERAIEIGLTTRETMQRIGCIVMKDNNSLSC